MNAPAAPREGQELASRYRLLRRLGEGGFGTVFEAEHLRIPGRRLALKVLNPLFTADPKLRDRFLREVEAASRLTHPNVIVMREVDATPEGIYFCTMDLSPGRSLRQILNREGRIEPRRAALLAAQVLDALNHAHERGVIHRDMKPENVLVESDAAGREVAKVLDFGLAKLLDADDSPGGRSQFTTPGSVVGTLQYISPEQAEATGAIDGRADQYAVGVMLFELLTGRLPFEAPSAMGFAIAHMTRPAPRLRDVAVFDSFSDDLERAVARALQKRPEQRFFEARAFGEALLEATARLPAAPGVPTDLDEPPPPARSRAAQVFGDGPGEAARTIPSGRQPAARPAGPDTEDAFGDGGPPDRLAPSPSQASRAAPPVAPPASAAQPSPSQAPGAGDAQGALAGLKPGAMLGRYRLEKEIGGGGMGKVFRARHVHMNRVAAIKVLMPDLAGDPAIRARFLREARIASVLQHPSVVELYDFEEQESPQPEGSGRGFPSPGGSLCWLAMELVQGRPLNEVVSAAPAKRLELPRIARIMDQVLDALAAAHQAGIVHRDLKPSNIMLGADDRVTLLDFGIARILEPSTEAQAQGDAHLTQLGEFLGTPAYAAPEQIQGRAVDGRTDLYTASVILFQLLAGRRPFESPTAKGYLVKHVIETPPLLSSVRPDLPRVGELDVLLARGLAKDPGARFQTAPELRAALLAVLPPPSTGGGGGAPPAGASGSYAGAEVPAAGFSGAFPAHPGGAPASPAAPASQGIAAPPPSSAQGVPAMPPSGPQAGMSAMPTAAPASGPSGTRAFVAVRGARSVAKLFLVGGGRLAFGRSREDEKRGVRNHVVLRVLPCRDQAQDPANWAATMRLSNAHGEIGVQGAAATVLDRSSRGIALHGAPLAKDVPTPLPDAFDLDIAGGALRLFGRVARGGSGGRGAPVEAVVLRRLGNAEGHVYVLLPASLTVGSDPACGLVLDTPGVAPVHAVIAHAPGGFRIVSAAGPGDAPLEVDRAPLEPGASAPLAVGRRVRLGGVELEPREMIDAEFTAP